MESLSGILQCHFEIFVLLLEVESSLNFQDTTAHLINRLTTGRSIRAASFFYFFFTFALCQSIEATQVELSILCMLEMGGKRVDVVAAFRDST